MRSYCKGALPLSLAATSESGDVLVVALPAPGAPKRSPVPVGLCFIVEKEYAEKWPLKQHTSMVAKEKFIVALCGVRCSEPGCQNPGFAEVGFGETNHVSRLQVALGHISSFMWLCASWRA